MSKIELLAPAGSSQSVIPAIRLGADAIYIGAAQFNARGNAGNFDKEELKRTVEYCHVRDRKVYLTVNTLVRDEEIQDVLKLIEYAAQINIDAIIVQDIGLASLIRSCVPSMRLHGSTQMSIHTPAGARALYDAGFSRVVLSRELSKNEIKEIAKASPIELEVFVHGALCMSVSGQCYFSAMLGGRSGNRGLCAQPCRLPFLSNGGTGNDLSLKDLSIIRYLKELEQIGVTSAKIEGRMKRPEYVAAAVSACRKAIDDKVDEDDIKLLESVFARSGFTDGYYTAKRGRTMFGIRSKEDVTAATSDVFSKLHALYKDEKQTIPIKFSLKVKEGEQVQLTASDDHGNTAESYWDKPEKAIKVPLSVERCEQQLKKTGSTPFLFDSADFYIDDGLTMPISALNSMRREVLENIENQRKQRKGHKFSTNYNNIVENYKPQDKLKIRARFPSAQIPKCFDSCEMVYIPLSSSLDDIKRLVDRGLKVALEIPRGMFGREKAIINQLERARNIGINNVWAANIGAVELANNIGMNIHGGFGLNILNTTSVEWAEDNGLCDIETSFELTLEQIKKLGGNIKRGIIAYGRIPLMLTRNCPIANSEKGCLNCGTPQKITDRKGVKFPIMCEGGCSEVLNSVPLYMSDRKREIKGVDFIVLRYTVENSVEMEESFKSFNSVNTTPSNYTRGLYYKGVD